MAHVIDVRPAPQQFFGREWPGPARTAPPVVPIAAAAAGLTAAATLPLDRPGLGWFLTAVAAAVATLVALFVAGRTTDPSTDETDESSAARRSIAELSTVDRVTRVAWALAALALMAVGALRAAEWLFVLCVLSAAVAGAMALAGGRSLRGLFLGAMAIPIAVIRALPWTTRGLQAARGGSGSSVVRTAAAALVGLALLVVFGALFAGADAAFADVLDDVLPTIDAAAIVRWPFLFTVVGLGTLAACFLALAPPTFDAGAAPRRSLRRIEWALPVGLLVALFAGFVAVQVTVLFGGRDHVLRTAGLTYAEYARSGFGQLLVVTMLTLVVITVVAAKASRQSPADRIWLRALLGGLAALALVVVASALSRMWAYEHAYGFTQLRLLVSAFELWLGVVFLLVIVAGATGGMSAEPGRFAAWLPGAVVGTGIAALIALAALNPDRFIADQNVTRYEETGRIDLEYLSSISADAVPALYRLPAELHPCVLDHIARDLTADGPDSWNEWNLGRAEARRLLADYEPLSSSDQWLACRNVSTAGR
jgi:MFS family permease